MSDQMDRRRFLTVLGVTGGGAAALGACGVDPQATRKLVPYLVQPEDQVPGVATWYATTCRECPSGCGVHAKVREGRVIKLEGNPESPINHGHLCARVRSTCDRRYGVAPRPPAADLFPPRRARRASPNPLHVLPLLRSRLERTGHPVFRDLLRLSPDDQRLHAGPCGPDPEGPRSGGQ